MATDFQSYLESSNERLQDDLLRSSGLGPADATSFTERTAASAQAAGVYRAVMEEQNARDLQVAAGRGLAVVAGGFLGGGIGAYGAGKLFDFGADFMGWHDPKQVYSQNEWTKSQIARSMDTSLDSVFTNFQFGGRGISMDQSNELAGDLFNNMRSQGFQGLELERMMPMLSASGILTPQGNYDSQDQAVDELAGRLETLTSKIGDAVKKASLSIEEATAFVIRENKLAGGDVGLGDNRLMGSMQGLSSATGMTYDESMRFMTSSIGEWGGTSSDLIPFTEAAAVSAVAGQAAYQTSARSTSWDRAGGVAAVAGGYASAGNDFWMEDKNRDRLGRMWASGNLNSGTFYDMGEGGRFDSDANPYINDINDRYEAEYNGMQALARDPLSAQTAMFGGYMSEMEKAGVTSRNAQAVWLTRNKGMNIVQAEASIEQHYAVSTSEGRAGAYFGSVRTGIAERGESIDRGLEQGAYDARALSGEHDAGARNLANTIYSGGYIEGEGDVDGYYMQSDAYIEGVRAQMDRVNTTTGEDDGSSTNVFFSRQGSSQIGADDGRLYLDSALAAQQAQLGLRGIELTSADQNAALASMSFDEITKFKRDRTRWGDPGFLAELTGTDAFKSAINAYDEENGIERFGEVATRQQSWEIFGMLDAETQNTILNEAQEAGRVYTDDEGVQDSYFDAINAGMQEDVDAEHSNRLANLDIISGVYGNTAADARAQEATAAYIESGAAAGVLDGLDIGEIVDSRRGVDNVMRSISALNRVTPGSQGFAHDLGTKDAYGEMASNLAGTSVGGIVGNLDLDSDDAADHIRLRDEITAMAFPLEGGGNQSFDDLTSTQQAFINEWIYETDTSTRARPGEKEGEGTGKDWGGTQDTVLESAAEALYEDGNLAAGVDATQFVMSDNARAFTATAKAITEEDGLAWSDVANYRAITGSGEYTDAELVDLFGGDLAALEETSTKIDVAGGGYNLNNAQAHAVLMAEEVVTLAAGITADQIFAEGEEATFMQAIATGDREYAANIDRNGLSEEAIKWLDDEDYSTEELASASGIEITPAAQANIDNAGRLEQVSRNLSVGITTVAFETGTSVIVEAPEGGLLVKQLEE